MEVCGEQHLVERVVAGPHIDNILFLRAANCQHLLTVAEHLHGRRPSLGRRSRTQQTYYLWLAQRFRPWQSAAGHGAHLHFLVVLGVDLGLHGSHRRTRSLPHHTRALLLPPPRAPTPAPGTPTGQCGPTPVSLKPLPDRRGAAPHLAPAWLRGGGGSHAAGGWAGPRPPGSPRRPAPPRPACSGRRGLLPAGTQQQGRGGGGGRGGEGRLEGCLGEVEGGGAAGRRAGSPIARGWVAVCACGLCVWVGGSAGAGRRGTRHPAPPALGSRTRAASLRCRCKLSLLHQQLSLSYPLFYPFILVSSVDNATMWEPASNQPGWLEQMSSSSILFSLPLPTMWCS